MINPFLVIAAVLVLTSGVISYRETKSMKKATFVALITTAVIFILSLVVDLFIE